ncbi:Na+/phosphate symporter [Thermanaerovibrio velox DSM 12556]|uniref:Na+/phosphate symporter n=1 Tax=Thermanaerovibrio velox DSM 12556 TaxID=926567 RepID=H0UPE9_9BACT|nr:Na/Pi symporter [Thermanaerovibrio velox]EHM10580.1 Na+/phosphate symporter [Thermanaerovibrio velox DSM 12556]
MGHLLILAGGIVLFLFGVDESSRASRAALGERERALMARFAANPLGALVLGGVLSFLSQSSSVATSFAMGLVDIGALSFSSSIVTMMGSSVGASMVTFLLSLDVSYLGPGFLLLGAGASNFPSGVSRYGGLLRGMGIVLVGMLLIKTGVSPLMSSPGARVLVGYLADRPLLLALGAFLATCAFQSSSAVVALGIAMASSGVLGLKEACWLVVGSHGGSFGPVMLASIGKKLSARRLAWATGIYKVLGGVMGAFLVGPFAARAGLPPVLGIPAFMGFLTVVNGLALFPLTGWLAQASTVLAGTARRPGERAYIDDALAGFPEVAYRLLEKEMGRLADMEDRFMGMLRQLQTDPSVELRLKPFAEDGMVDLADSCIQYLDVIEDPSPRGIERKRRLAQVLLCLRSMGVVLTRDLYPLMAEVARSRELMAIEGVWRSIDVVREVLSASVGAWVLGDKQMAARAVSVFEPLSHRGFGLYDGISSGERDRSRIWNVERVLLELGRLASELAELVLNEEV